MRVKENFEAGLIFIVFGMITAGMSMSYTIGTPDQMGAGFFPLVVGCGLVLLGGALLCGGLRSLAEAPSLQPLEVRALLAVVGSVVAFGFLVNRAGLVVAIPISVFIAALAQQRVQWLRTAVFASIVTFACYLIFSVGLDVRLPVLVY